MAAYFMAGLSTAHDSPLSFARYVTTPNSGCLIEQFFARCKIISDVSPLTMYTNHELTMKKLYVVGIAAGLLLTISGPSFAAKKPHPSTTQGAVKKNRGVLPPPHSSRVPPFDYRRGTSDYPFGPGINFPYPDRPYGDPSRWGEN